MRHYLLALVLVGGAFTAFAAAQSESIESFIRSYRMRPCESWRWVRTVDGESGYLCSFQGMMIEVPDAYDVERVIQDLENRVRELEQRVAELEGQTAEQ